MKRIRPCIGISQCLTDSIVRYDAKTQFNKNLINELSRHFELVPICPEVECGLGVPRPPVELVETGKGIKVLGRDNKALDVSDSLMSYSANKILSLGHLSGYVFKTRSPSCGVSSTPVYNLNGDLDYYTKGIFTAALIKQYPGLPVIEDIEFRDNEQFESFVNSVLAYKQNV